MYIKELTINEFEEYTSRNKLDSFYQTRSYAILMAEFGYEHEYIGYFDDNKIVAASLILYKSLNGINFGYAPRGFLIDYMNFQLLSKFTKDLIEYYYNKEFAFIKINPNIKIGLLNKTKEFTYNKNYVVRDYLRDLGYLKLKDNMYFESMLPRLSPVIDLNSYRTSDLSKNTRNKIKKGIRKGLKYRKGTIEDLYHLETFTKATNFYLNDVYNIFSKESKAEIYIVEIDTIKYLKNSQAFYDLEYEKNQNYNRLMVKKNTPNNINTKMNSDRALLAYKKDVMEATKLSDLQPSIVVAAALVINHNNKAEIISSGYDDSFKRFSPNYYLHYSIIKNLKKSCSFLNLNGVSADFSSESLYKGLNDFKLGFNPDVYENIGEYDLVVSKKAYDYLLRNKLIQKEFKKK